MRYYKSINDLSRTYFAVSDSSGSLWCVQVTISKVVEESAKIETRPLMGFIADQYRNITEIEFNEARDDAFDIIKEFTVKSLLEKPEFAHV